MPPYRAPWWLPGGHLQTLYPYLALGRRPPRYRRSRWETPDGDFIDIDWLAQAPAEAPLLVLFHGLEGSSASHYAGALMRAVERRGWRGAVVHFRGCSGEPNRLARAYHSGDADEIDWILRRLRAAGRQPLFAAGVSLGGNALLKWLGREGEAARAAVDATAAVSAPIALSVAGERLGRGVNRLYGMHFLHTLKAKSLAKLRQFPGLYDAAAVRRARTLREFDDVVTAPLHGFRDADDYWTRAASKPGLGRIAVPTLIVHARNDPFLPGAWLPGGGEVSGSVTLEYTRAGGHAGFAAGPFPGNLDWLPARLIAFFSGFAPRME
ncbi:MAG TPA: hydrolase [Burkholderiales bacterium]|nr:hydrolase [Burkholderiales bacterium]